jgi:hypothetical protein
MPRIGGRRRGAALLLAFVVGFLLRDTWNLLLTVADSQNMKLNGLETVFFPPTTNSSILAISSPTKVVKEDQQHLPSFHVLLALAGDHQGFFREVDVLLKSLLLNAPDQMTLEIHILTDGPAYIMLDNLLFGGDNDDDSSSNTTKRRFSTNLSLWKSTNPVVVRTYNCEPHIKRWKHKIRQLYRRGGMDTQSARQDLEYHTIGTWFRLLAHEVLLPSSVENILFIDSDVVLLANIQDLSMEYSDTSHYFQWGTSRCAGFLIVNIPKLEEMWNTVDSFGLRNAQQQIQKSSSIMADQFFLRTFELAQPDKVGWLPDHWDNTMASTLWRWKKNLVAKRPQIGYIHFNGGGHHTSQDASWFLENTTDPTVLLDNTLLTSRDTGSSFGIAGYYIRLPWKWARYFAEAKIPKWSNGSLIEIHYNRSLSHESSRANNKYE